jgi:hypothetical protein
MHKCPFSEEVIRQIKTTTEPICFHCGQPYILDIVHCSPKHNTWKPNCNCLTTTAVRIVTGVYYV